MSYEYLARTIEQSPEIIEGLNSGTMTLEGGVIRVAKGNEGAGQIVRHLKFPNDPSQSLESLGEALSGGVGKINKSLETLKSLQCANLVLSGVNLAVSVAGFMIMNKKLNTITDILKDNSVKIDKVLSAINDSNERIIIEDLSRFSATMSTAQQFMKRGDDEHLIPLILPIKQQYIYSRDILRKTLRAALNAQMPEDIKYIFALRDRVVNLGLCLSNVQSQSGFKYEAVEALELLKTDWYELNQDVYNLALGQNILSSIKSDEFINLKNFMSLRAEAAPVLEYQSNLLQLSIERPDLEKIIFKDNKELLLIAA